MQAGLFDGLSESHRVFRGHETCFRGISGNYEDGSKHDWEEIAEKFKPAV